MKITLTREVFADKFTLGRMYINGRQFGFTCEDKDRKMEDGNEKIYGKTAIPRGKYRVVLTFSHRFNRIMPELLGVKGFEGIRIHGGNTEADTEGCVLLGKNRIQNGCANCAEINKSLIALIEEAEDHGEEVWITVE